MTIADCPHRELYNNKTFSCKLVKSLNGPEILPGPETKNHLCNRCFAEWDGKIPSNDFIPLSIQKLVNRKPNILEKAANFAKETVRFISHGLPTVSDEERRIRLEICHANCPYLQEDSSCKICGCNVEEASKWATKQCGAGFWPANQYSNQNKCGSCGKR